jgi:hypothetical protein
MPKKSEHGQWEQVTGKNGQLYWEFHDKYGRVWEDIDDSWKVIYASPRAKPSRSNTWMRPVRFLRSGEMRTASGTLGMGSVMRLMWDRSVFFRACRGVRPIRSRYRLSGYRADGLRFDSTTRKRGVAAPRVAARGRAERPLDVPESAR